MPNRPNPQQEPESECCQETHHHHLEYLKNRMPTQQEMDDAAELFKVFGDPTRLKLLAALLAQEMCVCDLRASLSRRCPISCGCSGPAVWSKTVGRASRSTIRWTTTM